MTLKVSPIKMLLGFASACAFAAALAMRPDNAFAQSQDCYKLRSCLSYGHTSTAKSCIEMDCDMVTACMPRTIGESGGRMWLEQVVLESLSFEEFSVGDVFLCFKSKNCKRGWPPCDADWGHDSCVEDMEAAWEEHQTFEYFLTNYCP